LNFLKKIIMGNELEEVNLRELTTEILAIGLPESVAEDLQRQTAQEWKGHLSLPFDTQVEGLPVKGHLHLERPSTFGLLEVDYLHVDVGDDPAAKYIENNFFFPSDAVTLREAVNLMEGRTVYRPITAENRPYHFWLYLDRVGIPDTIQSLGIILSDFRPERAIRESPLGRFLDEPAQEKLAAQLLGGDRVKVEVGPPGRERTVYLETDIWVERLRATDSQRQEVRLKDMLQEVAPGEHRLGHGRGR
jgi:hypothetical protein